MKGGNALSAGILPSTATPATVLPKIYLTTVLLTTVLLTTTLIFGLVLAGCDNGTTVPNNGSYDISVTISGIPSEYTGRECEIAVNPSADTFGFLVYSGIINETVITVNYNLAEDDTALMKVYDNPYNANGNYWIEFDIEEPFYDTFITRNSVKFSSGKATADFSEFVRGYWQ